MNIFFLKLSLTAVETKNLHTVVVDFEAAAWVAVRATFPGVSVHGCHFRYCQAVYRKVFSSGLGSAYRSQGPVRDLVRLLFALPFLPPQDMKAGLRCVKEKIKKNTDEKITNLLLYVEKTWFKSSVWKPEDFCVYRCIVRTNNDVEGYHRRLSVRCGYKPKIYRLIKNLYQESQLVELTFERSFLKSKLSLIISVSMGIPLNFFQGLQNILKEVEGKREQVHFELFFFSFSEYKEGQKAKMSLFHFASFSPTPMSTNCSLGHKLDCHFIKASKNKIKCLGSFMFNHLFRNQRTRPFLDFCQYYVCLCQI